MTKNKEFTEVLEVLEDVYGWNDTNELTEIQASLVNDVISVVKKLTIPVVSITLPDDFWYSDENGNEVHLVGTVKDWCVVENRITEDTWVEPFEFVNALYNDSLQGNEC